MNKEQKYVGVDISKEYLDMAIVEPDNKWRFGNNACGIGKAVERLKGLSPVFVVFEATGGLELSFWEALTEAGIEAAPINPRQIRDFAKAKGKLAKTDATTMLTTMGKIPKNLFFKILRNPIEMMVNAS